MNIGTRIKDMFTGMWEDTRAVSPIVATLVLVVVAITGAAAVGTIMGTFSSDVSDQSNTGELADASSTEILIAGSTTVQPVSELLAEAYMDDHQGVKITVQGGGSGAGVSSVGMDIVDIGAASRDPKSEEMAKFPDIKTHKIGGSAVVVIVNKDTTLINISKAEINDAYVNHSFGTDLTSAAITKVFDRSEASGTEETFCKWIGNTTFHSSVVGKSGNAGVLKAVEDTKNSIGFVDFGFADGSDDVIAIGLIDGGKQYNVTESNIKDQLKTDGTSTVTYPYKMARPLNYMTNGEPNSMERAFITFAMSPGAATYFEECGYFPVTSIA
jgi:phosphate transport system substrate-binding protein